MNVTAYRDGVAMWRALSDRARTTARSTGRPPHELMRRFVYDRFLARVFADPDEPWVLKGGIAMLARVTDARHTKDVDLLRSLGNTHDALAALGEALKADLADHFRFVITAARPAGGAPQPDVAGLRLKIDAYCGTLRCESFGVDVVTGSLMTAEPEPVTSSLPLQLPGLLAPTVRAYPVVDHIADKLAATETIYADGRRSSRTRDLIDLVIFARTQAVDGAALNAAIVAERLHRGLPPCTTFTAPPEWERNYSSLAATTPVCEGLHRLDAAVATVAAFLEPAMSGATSGHRWDPGARSWTPSASWPPTSPGLSTG